MKIPGFSDERNAFMTFCAWKEMAINMKKIKIWLPIFLICLVLLGIFLSRYFVQETTVDKPGCDRFANELINYKKRYGLKTEILPSAPVKNTWTGAVIGNQPLTIYLDEPIVVQWTDKKGYPDQYCDTPSRYFNQLEKAYNLKLKAIKVYANSGEASKVVDAARFRQAKVIGLRVFNKADYEPVKKWLAEDKTHRAVLFHSAVYEEGAKLFTEFRRQTTFGDLCPEIIGKGG
jgi:hypothetical protein